MHPTKHARSVEVFRCDVSIVLLAVLSLNGAFVAKLEQPASVNNEWFGIHNAAMACIFSFALSLHCPPCLPLTMHQRQSYSHFHYGNSVARHITKPCPQHHSASFAVAEKSRPCSSPNDTWPRRVERRRRRSEAEKCDGRIVRMHKVAYEI